MSNTYSDIVDLIKSAVNLDTRLDDLIVSALRQAIRWLERNHTLRYMRRLENDTIGADASTIPMTGDIKAVDEVLFLHDAAGEEVTQLSYDEDLLIADTDPAVPTKYRLHITKITQAPTIGSDTFTILLDRVTDTNYWLRLDVVRYTPWPLAGDEATHWLFDSAEDVLLNRAILQLAPFTRDKELTTEARTLLAEGLKTLLAADYAMDQPRSGTQKMGYGS